MFTVIAVGAGYERLEPEPGDSRLLLEEAGFVVEQYGAPFVQDGRFHLPLRISNHSQAFDVLQLQLATVNGIVAPLVMAQDILPGSVRYTYATIDTHRTILDEAFAQFQYLFDGLTNLEVLGIEEVQEVQLRFAADRRDLLDKTGQGHVRRLLSPITLSFSDQSTAFAIDEVGEELFFEEGIRITRLASDPTGKRLLIQNSSNRTLKVSTQGATLVDGVPYSDNAAILVSLPPGQAAYTELFSTLPGIFPEGQELSIAIHLMDIEENRLVYRSAPFTLPLFP